MHRTRGFTLLELLVALAIVAILAAASVPSFRDYLLNQKLRAATERLASDLRWARQSAVERGALVVACPGDAELGCGATAAWHSGWIVFQDENGDRRLSADEDVLRITQALAHVSARSSGSRRQLIFFPNGTAPGSNLTIRLCTARGPNHARQVRVALSGRIRTLTTRDGAEPGC